MGEDYLHRPLFLNSPIEIERMYTHYMIYDGPLSEEIQNVKATQNLREEEMNNVNSKTSQSAFVRLSCQKSR